MGLISGSDSYKWKEKIFVCIIIDITESKVAEEELRLGIERYKIILDQSSDIILSGIQMRCSTHRIGIVF